MTKFTSMILATLIVLFSSQVFAQEEPTSMTFKSSSTYFKVFKNPSTSWNPYGDGVAVNCNSYYLDTFVPPLPQYDPLLSASALCGPFDYDEIDTYAVYKYDSSPGDEFDTNLDGTPRQFFRVQIYCQRETGQRTIPKQIILHCVDHKSLEMEKLQKQP